MTRRRDRPSEAPLLVWADRQKATKTGTHLRRRAAAVGAGIMLVAITIAVPPTPRLIWNATASAPLGLYWIEPGADIEVGDFAAAWPPEAARRLAADRFYLPYRVPLVKQVAAIAGDDVCALGQEILINELQAGDRQLFDPRGRPLPGWTGCVRLRGRALFLLSRTNPASYDGRYFGITGRQQIVGKAHPLWTR